MREPVFGCDLATAQATLSGVDYLDTIRAQNRRVVVSIEVYDPAGKSSVMRRAATLEEAVKQVKEAMEKTG